MLKRTLLLIPLIISLVYTSPSDTLEYRQRKRRKAPAAYLDVSSGAQRVIESDHSHIHNYEAFSISLIDTLTDQEVLMVVVHIPDTIDFHLKSITVWGEGSPFLAKILNNPDTLRMSTDTINPQNRNQANNKNNFLFPSGCTVTDSADTISGDDKLATLGLFWYEIKE